MAMPLGKNSKIMMQCDFDGTVTENDISFLILDRFGSRDWRQVHAEYVAGKIPVGVFNARVFAGVRAEEQALLDFIAGNSEVKVRPGFKELLAYCSANGLEFTIVSNGLKFYIDAILSNMNLKHIKAYAAESQFTPGGMAVRYVGPDGGQPEDGFKEAYTKLFRKRGYRVIYLGNGISDLRAAQRASHTFARAELLQLCRGKDLSCTPFEDFHDVIRGLERLQSG